MEWACPKCQGREYDLDRKELRFYCPKCNYWMEKVLTAEESQLLDQALIKGGFPGMIEKQIELGLCRGQVNRWDDGSWEITTYDSNGGFSIMRNGPRFEPKPPPDCCPRCGTVDPQRCREDRCKKCLVCHPPGSYSYYPDQCDSCGWDDYTLYYD